MRSVLEIGHLSKSFGSVRAVDDLSFSVREGELFAFLGVNGAGKSTTISILCGQLQADAGTVRVLGKAPQEARPGLGVVFQNSVLDAALTVRDNLRCRASLYGIHGEAFEKRMNELASLLDFSDLQSRTVSKLSGGQRRRIDIARALLHNPELLILDEPTTGLDPQTRKLLWDVIANCRKETGMTVLLTTHYMEEAADADRVVIIDSGRLTAEGTPNELKNRFAADFLTLYGVTEEELALLGKPYEKVGSGFRLSVENCAEATALITAHPEVFKDYELVKGRMDDVFLNVTGKLLNGGDRA